jgi:ABC-2 type transport system ATP-binding protein
MSELAIEASDVVKRYGDFVAVDRVSITVPRGAIFGMLGPNGAGKSSTIRMLLRIMLPDEGSIRVLGGDVSALDVDRIGYLPEERGLYKKMKVGELLVFFAEIKGVPRAEARRRAVQWLERVGLLDRATRPVEELSKGMQQKVQFIATVIHDPELLVLDEPFSGLDPVNANVLRDIMLDFHRRGRTVVFCTHVMDQVEKLCEHICLINRGKVVLSGPLAAIKKQYGHNGVTVRFSGDGAFLKSLPEVASFQDHGNELFLRLHDGAAATRVLDAARGKIEILRFEVAEASVHDIFVERVSES